MNLPQRIQRKRTKGFKLPHNTLCVSRPNKWGNPFAVKEYGIEKSLQMYEVFIKPLTNSERLEILQYDYLACWCPLDKPCHVDVLIKLLKETQ